MSAKTLKSAIDGLMKTACNTEFTLGVKQIIVFIKQAIDAICAELTEKGKTPIMSSKEALSKAKANYFDKDLELAEEVDFFSDRDAMVSIYDYVYTLLTQTDYEAEAVYLIERIKQDEQFAYNFFYGTSMIHGKSIARIRARILNQLRLNFHLEVDASMISTIIYEHLWSEGTWKNLDSFKYRSSFFYWLSTVASHATLKFLEENGYIKLTPTQTVGNTRLVLKSKDKNYCKMVIDDMVHITLLNDFLTAMYVDRLSREDIQKKFCLDENEYKLTRKVAEKALKVALLNTEHHYDDVLVDKVARKVSVSSDFLSIIGQTNATDEMISPLRDVLGIGPDDADFDDKVEEFLYDFSNKLFTTELDKVVWQGRFIQNISPVEMAEELGRTRGWVDCRFAKSHKKFKTAIRTWWKSMI